MKEEKSIYESPVTSVIDVRMEGFICQSRGMKFGSNNSSGNFDDDDVIYGGSF